MTSPRRGLTSAHGTSIAGDWWERAACRTADPDAFTPPPDEYRVMTTTEAAYARTYCARCPVKAECLAEAIRDGDDYGIRGGIDMASRNKRRRAAQAATPQEPPTAPSKHAKRSPTWQASQDAAKAARRARAEEARAELAAQVKDLVADGADFERAARATNKTVGALEKALYRAKRPDLIEKLKQRAA